jgi:MFS transporter, DHA3 family, tetracycline resistance protein
MAGADGGAAALATGHFGAPRRIATVIWAAWGTGCLAVLGLSFAPGVVAVAAFLALAFAMQTVGNLLWHTMMQRLVPGPLLGRASSVDSLFSLSLKPLGVLVGGVLATSIRVRGPFLLGGAIATAASLAVISPRVREPDRSGLFGRDADRSDSSQRT